MAVGDKQWLISYVHRRAPDFHIDPAAALAVASREGMNGGIGDNGTSFGPWQLHIGGALPVSYASFGPNSSRTQEWAWSPAGVDYALKMMANLGAAGKTGADAIHAIVYNFERPFDPASEAAAALAAYDSFTVSGITSPLTKVLVIAGGGIAAFGAIFYIKHGRLPTLRDL
jgi:hypothetical protein